MLGLAQRAGKLASGEDKALQAIQSRKSHLVIVAKDASVNTYKKFNDKCTYYEVPLIHGYDRQSLGHATGKVERVVISVNDRGFAEAMLRKEKPCMSRNILEVKGIE